MTTDPNESSKKPVYYCFGQDRRKVGAQTSLDSFPQDWLRGKAELPVPVHIHLDDPLGRDDAGPSSGAGTLGDIIDGAQSCYSKKLGDALKEFGVNLDLTLALIYLPGVTEPNSDYYMVRGVPNAECLIDKSGELDYFEIDPSKTNGLHMFDVASSNYGMWRARIIDEVLKQHLEKLDLKGVYVIPTTEYGGWLKTQLKMG